MDEIIQERDKWQRALPESEEPRIYKSGRRGRFNSRGYQVVAGKDAINQESMVF